MKKIIATGAAALVAGALAVSPAFATASTNNDAVRNGNSAFVRNSWVQAGLKSDGTFGSDSADLPGSNFDSTTVDGPTGSLGLIADGNEDGTFEDGDFFLPGTPYEGWSIKVGDGVSHVTGNEENNSNAVSGSWTSDETTGDASVTWNSSSDVDGIGITQNVSAPSDGGHLFHVTVTLQNNSGSDKKVYYMRQVDPDNAVDPYYRDFPDEYANESGDYNTFNAIQANDSTSQIVTATTYYNYSTIGYRASDPDAVVRISDWSDPLSGAENATLTSAELDAQLAEFASTFKAGYQDYTDNTIDIAFHKQIAAGASATIEFDYILSPALGNVPDFALDLSLDLAVGSSYANAATALAGGGLMPNSAYTLTEHSDPRLVFSGTTLPNGNFYDETNLPNDCVPGSHTLILTGTAPDGSSVSDWVTYTVDDSCTVTAFDPYAKANGAPNPDASLPNTGVNVAAVVSLAGILAMLGAGVVLMTRRRKLA